MRPMRRANRQITDPAEVRALIERCHTVRVGAVDEDGVFVVPLNFGYEWVGGRLVLYLLSAYYPSIPRINYDGIFGTATRDAVIAFQQQLRLNPDGIVGPATWSALYDTYLGILGNIPSAPDSGTMEYTVRPGDTLWLLAQRFNTTVDAIKALNNLTSDLLHVGQKLLIPVKR